MATDTREPPLIQHVSYAPEPAIVSTPNASNTLQPNRPRFHDDGVANRTISNGVHPSFTPPASPTQNLLNAQEPAQAVPNKQRWSVMLSRFQTTEGQGWVPIPLRLWFWVPLVSFMAILAIVLEISVAVTKSHNGWPTGSTQSAQQGLLHYLYILPAVIAAMTIVAMWAWADIEIKKMQPYLDLYEGQSPAHRSLLLDYTRTNNFFVWTRAAANRHFLVVLATLLVLLTLTFQPLAAALLTVRDTWFTLPVSTVENQGSLGLNQNREFQDLTSFMTAAGYASASVLYGLGDPPFVNDWYTIAPFQLPRSQVANGTVVANTTAVKSEPNCQSAESLTMTQTATGWSNAVSANGCSGTFIVDKSAPNLFGTSVANCTSGGYASQPPPFGPVLFWFFTYQPSAAAAATFCFPTISLWDVTVKVDIATGNLTKVIVQRQFDPSYSPYASTAGNITGPPLNGRAYNGIEFQLPDTNPFVLARRDAIHLQLPSSVVQLAQADPGGLPAAFSSGKFTNLTTQVYRTYLKLIASSVYYLPETAPLAINISTFRKRLWLSEFAAHALAALLLSLALCGTTVQLLHRRRRRGLRLSHEPGTIASAVSIGAQTNVADLLDGKQNESEFESALRNKKFRIDPSTMKLVMEGERGYDDAKSPDPRRSLFGFLPVPGSNRRLSTKSV